jgi:hypothetical protein
MGGTHLDNRKGKLMDLKDKSVWIRWVFPLLALYAAIIILGVGASLMVGSVNALEYAKLFGLPALAVLTIGGLITSNRTWAKLVGGGLIVINLISAFNLQEPIVGVILIVVGVGVGYGLAKLWRRVVGNYQPSPVSAADAQTLERKLTQGN